MGYHTFHVSFSRDGTSHLSELCKIAKKYGFHIQKDAAWISKMWKIGDYSCAFTCTRELSGLSHWLSGGELGMEVKAKAMAWDIQSYLKERKVPIEMIDLVYFSGSLNGND